MKKVIVMLAVIFALAQVKPAEALFPSSNNKVLPFVGAIAFSFIVPGVTHGIGNAFTNDNEQPGFGYTYLGSIAGAIAGVGLLLIDYSLKDKEERKKGLDDNSIWYALGGAVYVAGAIIAYKVASKDKKQELDKSLATNATYLSIGLLSF